MSVYRKQLNRGQKSHSEEVIFELKTQHKSVMRREETAFLVHETAKAKAPQGESFLSLSTAGNLRIRSTGSKQGEGGADGTVQAYGHCGLWWGLWILLQVWLGAIGKLKLVANVMWFVSKGATTTQFQTTPNFKLLTLYWKMLKHTPKGLAKGCQSTTFEEVLLPTCFMTCGEWQKAAISGSWSGRRREHHWLLQRVVVRIQSLFMREMHVEYLARSLEAFGRHMSMYICFLTWGG